MAAPHASDLRRARPLNVSAPPSAVARRVAQALSGYLCGTHWGGIAHAGRRRSNERSPERVALAHRALDAPFEGGSVIGGPRWTVENNPVLCEQLRRSLAHPDVFDLVLFGSQAHGGTTGFSDVDAILVISDAAAEDAVALRNLRPRVLAAQRVVLGYQPMQHHGFEVATPKLLRQASAALALPAAALHETRSLNGRTLSAWLTDDTDQGREAFVSLVRQLLNVHAWPQHVWKAHRLIAMFELLPVLYLQALGRATPKRLSFDEAREEFASAWWPYDVLNEVRLSWPRRRRRALEFTAAIARNPWKAVAAWRRLPARLPDPVHPLLTDHALEGLQALAQTMAQQAG